MHRFLVILLITGLLPLSAAAADPDAARGRALTHACAACHGPDGRSQGAIPSIDHLPAEDFIAALKAFRTDARQGTVMNRIAKGVDDAEINAMAVYIAGRRGR
jgi:cytochrome c553